MLEDQTTDENTVWFLNGRLTFRRGAASEPEGVCIIEQLMAQGDSPPLHLHQREDEVFHILDGVVRLRVGDTEIIAHAGETLLAPKGVPHSFRIESPRARFLTITVGGDFEAMVREMSRPAGEDLPPFTQPTEEMVATLALSCERHHIDIMGPPLAA